MANKLYQLAFYTLGYSLHAYLPATVELFFSSQVVASVGLLATTISSYTRTLYSREGYGGGEREVLHARNGEDGRCK
jgi:hypothetical protein